MMISITGWAWIPETKNGSNLKVPKAFDRFGKHGRGRGDVLKWFGAKGFQNVLFLEALP
jgi:hypothetical protein